MNREQAQRRFDALSRMTVARGCSLAEAATAATIAQRIARTFGFGGEKRHWWEKSAPVAQDMHKAAERFGWEYRRCGKKRCWCARRPLHQAHGPYRYRKQRRGSHVHSVYVGGGRRKGA